jgi:hypothetical protein
MSKVFENIALARAVRMGEGARKLASLRSQSELGCDAGEGSFTP